MIDRRSQTLHLPDRWLPKSILSLRDYTLRRFVADLTSGLTVGLVALPLAMAFGIASGVPPQVGIYTAVVGGFLISLLSGSRCQIGGPTGAFVVIIAGIISKFGIPGLLMVTMMAGVLLIIMGASGLGSAVKFIPRPVTIGFTNGIAVLIASTQIKDFLGLRTGTVPGAFLSRMKVLVEAITTFHWETCIVAGLSMFIILIVPKIAKRVPGTIVALLFATVVTAVFHVHVATIGSQFGGIPTGLPHLAIPTFRTNLIAPLFPSAVTVALLAAVESLLSAVVADGMSGDRHNSNVELIAQGVANLLTPLVGGIPSTGAIARTATNIRAGATSPVSGMVHALTLLLILLVAAPLAKFIPLATLAAVLFVVCYNMGDWKEIGVILRLSNADRAVWVVTFGLTVFADLTVAVEVGIVLAALLYIHRVAQTTTVSTVTPDYIEMSRVHILQDKRLPSNVSILRIHGPFLFGTTEKLMDETSPLSDFAAIVILRLRNMTAIDATGLHAIEEFATRLKASGRQLVLCGARGQAADYIQRSVLENMLGKENILPDIQSALDRAQEIATQFGGIGEDLAADLIVHAPL